MGDGAPTRFQLDPQHFSTDPAQANCENSTFPVFRGAVFDGKTTICIATAGREGRGREYASIPLVASPWEPCMVTHFRSFCFSEKLVLHNSAVPDQYCEQGVAGSPFCKPRTSRKQRKHTRNKKRIQGIHPPSFAQYFEHMCLSFTQS